MLKFIILFSLLLIIVCWFFKIKPKQKLKHTENLVVIKIQHEFQNLLKAPEAFWKNCTEFSVNSFKVLLIKLPDGSTKYFLLYNSVVIAYIDLVNNKYVNYNSTYSLDFIYKQICRANNRLLLMNFV